MKKKIDLNKYWLQTNKMHRDLKWMSYDEWDEKTKLEIAEAIQKMKILLNTLTEKIER